MDIAIIVEGKNDRSRLRRLLSEDVDILCTFGTPGSLQVDKLAKQVGQREVYIFTDNDASGSRIRGILRDVFPDAVGPTMARALSSPPPGCGCGGPGLR